MTAKNTTAKKTARSAKKTGKAVGVKRGKPGAIKKPVTSRTPAQERFVRDLLIRGEAAIPTSNGELPPGATHKIVEDNDDDLPKVERELFSLY